MASVFSTFGVSVLMNSILVIRSLFGTRVREIENIRIQLHHFVFTNDDDSLVGKPPGPRTLLHDDATGSDLTNNERTRLTQLALQASLLPCDVEVMRSSTLWTATVPVRFAITPECPNSYIHNALDSD